MAAVGEGDSNVPGLGNGSVGVAQPPEGLNLLQVSELTLDS